MSTFAEQLAALQSADAAIKTAEAALSSAADGAPAAAPAVAEAAHPPSVGPTSLGLGFIGQPPVKGIDY